MSERIEEFEEEFHRLHSQFLNELTVKCVSVDNLLQALTLLPFALRTQYESTIQNMLPELEKKELICNLFHRLNPLFTFMDYKSLKHLVSKFGSPKLKKDMVSYAEKMQLFKKTTTVSQLIDCWPGLKVPQIDHKTLRATFEGDPKTYTLERLDHFRNLFYNEIRLSQFVSVSILMLLKPTNSFVATWFIPTAVVQELKQAISHMDRTFLQTEQILELSLGEQMLYQRRDEAEYMTSSMMGPLSAFTHVSTKFTYNVK